MKKFLIIFSFFMLSIFLPSTFILADTNEENYNKNVVYLTFDDGPGGKITEKVLDILKEEEVKGTFFVIGELAKAQPTIIKRMYDEGHSLGLHTYTHNKNKIYKNKESFLEENILCQKTIEEITGFKPFILRFPFGCNNSLYRLEKDMVDMLHTNGFKIYDWNVDSTDGMYPKLESYKIANKAKSNNPNAIVLMHCGYVNKQSADALSLVIKYYKEKNYEFKTIDENTTEIYKVKKTKK